MKLNMLIHFFEIIKETRIGIRDMISAVGVIKFLYKNKGEWKGNRLELLESFFRAYFRRLSHIYFERWECLIDYLDNVITFYFDFDEVRGQDGLKKLKEWYRLEKENREKSNEAINTGPGLDERPFSEHCLQ